MSMRARIVIVSLVAPAIAVAAPGRVLVADADPELVHAIESSLAPWRFTVVADQAQGDPAERAARANARFAVWREGSVLVVVDRELGTTERRPARSGPLDPVAAAAAALTVKTMMRLPPPPVEPVPSDPPEAVMATAGPSARASRGPALRISAEVGARVEDREQGSAGLRVRGALLVQPWARRGWRFGALVDAGPSADTDRAGFAGTWSDLGALALASWSAPLTSHLWIEPTVGAGLAYRVLDGAVGMTAQRESEVDLRVMGAVALRRGFGAFSVALALSGDATPSTSTYTRDQGMSQVAVFETPSIALALTLGVAVDLGR